MSEQGGFSVYTTKAGDAGAAGWRWALTLQGSGLTRAQAARVAKEVRERSTGLKVVVYSYGVLHYSEVGMTVRAA